MDNLPRRKTGLGWQNYDGMTVILNPEQEKIHELNLTGSWLWERLDGSHTIESLCSHMSEDFDVTLKTASQDIASFLSDLDANGLVQ